MANTTAICVIGNIAVVCRWGSGVDAIEVHIGFHHTALNQTAQYLTASFTPKAKGTDNIVASLSICNGVKEYTTGFLTPLLWGLAFYAMANRILYRRGLLQ